MLDSYIKEYTKLEDPELPAVLVSVYTSVSALDQLVSKAGKGTQIKMSSLRSTLTSIIQNIETANGVLKSIRTGESKDTVPKGINAILTRLLRVTSELANATVFASKGDRLTQREFVQSYQDSFPFEEFQRFLEKHIYFVRTLRTSAKMGASNHTDARISKLAASYSKYIRVLPTSLKGLPFTALKMPVTPLFKDLAAQIEPARLTRAGFKVTLVGDGYQVLEDQYILAFDYKEAGLDAGTKKVGKDFKVRQHNGPERVRRSEKGVTSISDMLNTINAKSHIKYALGSTKFIPNPRNPKIWLAWIVTEAQRKALEQTLRTVEVDWGLPFSLNDDD